MPDKIKRKSTKRIRSSPVLVYMLPAEKSHFEAAARRDSRSLSDWIRVNLREISMFPREK